MRPIPTAQQIVDVFIQNSWVKSCGEIMQMSTEKPNGKMCCVMAALAEMCEICWENHLENTNLGEITVYSDDNLYPILEKEYGVDNHAFWKSFDDGKPYYTEHDNFRNNKMSEVCAEASSMLEGVKKCDLYTLSKK